MNKPFRVPKAASSPGTDLHVAVADGLLTAQHAVVREPDDTDEGYDGRAALLAAALAHARKD